MHGEIQQIRRKYVVRILRWARIQARMGNWAKASVMIRECRDWTKREPKYVTSRQVENCISMMCKHEVSKEYARIA